MIAVEDTNPCVNHTEVQDSTHVAEDDSDNDEEDPLSRHWWTDPSESLPGNEGGQIGSSEFMPRMRIDNIESDSDSESDRGLEEPFLSDVDPRGSHPMDKGFFAHS